MQVIINFPIFKINILENKIVYKKIFTFEFFV